MRLDNVLESGAEPTLHQVRLVVQGTSAQYTWKVLKPLIMQSFEDFALHVVDEFFWVVFEADRLSGTLLEATVYLAEHTIAKLSFDIEQLLKIFFVINDLAVLRHSIWSPKRRSLLF